MIMRRFAPVFLSLFVALGAMASAANAQMDGRRSPSNSPTADSGKPAKRAAARDPDKVEIVGVVTMIDPATDRMTIAYEQTDALNLPAGERSFVASKDELLKGVTVGEKVRFSLDSQQIASLRPFRLDEAQ